MAMDGSDARPVTGMTTTNKAIAENEVGDCYTKDDAFNEQATAAAARAGGQTIGMSTLTDNRSTVILPTCRPPVCMPNGCVRPERYYVCDRQMVKVLAQYVSPEERHKVLAWLDVLDSMKLDDDDTMSERAMYMTCLVLLLKSGQLVPPFTRSPPSCRPLRTLRDVIDRHLFRKVLDECRKRRAYDPSRYVQPDRMVAQWPSEFYEQMPAPHDGILCYGAAFSFT